MWRLTKGRLSALASSSYHNPRSFSRNRPLRRPPWLQLTYRTFLDDAERRYGPKETWHALENTVLRKQLVDVMRQYLLSTIHTVESDQRILKKKVYQLRNAREKYSAVIAAASEANDPREILKEWAPPLEPQIPRAAQLMVRFAESQSKSKEVSSDAGQKSPGTPSSEVSAYPFLRDAARDRRHTLDKDLADWASAYFADDDQSQTPAVEPGSPINDEGKSQNASTNQQRPITGTSYSLRRSLSTVLKESGVGIVDGEGMSGNATSRGMGRNVLADPVAPKFKADWHTLMLSKEKSPQAQRAKDRLAELRRNAIKYKAGQRSASNV